MEGWFNGLFVRYEAVLTAFSSKALAIAEPIFMSRTQARVGSRSGLKLTPPPHDIEPIRGCEKMGTVPSADQIGSIESVNASGAKWAVPDFFTAPQLGARAKTRGKSERARKHAANALRIPDFGARRLASFDPARSLFL